MPKYRLLTREELIELEKDFVQYLVVNGITADDWEKLKVEDNEAAQNIVDLFSDVVFETIFRKVQYLELRTEKELISYQCLNEKLVIVGMKAPADSEADFTKPDYIQQAVHNPPEGLKVFTTEKNYTEQREIHLFHLTESGAVISDGKLFKALCLALPQNKS